jgi:hypothetical protein
MLRHDIPLMASGHLLLVSNKYEALDQDLFRAVINGCYIDCAENLKRESQTRKHSFSVADQNEVIII